MINFQLAARRIAGGVNDTKAYRALALALQAFATGARFIPLGDNGPLLRALTARARSRRKDR